MTDKRFGSPVLRDERKQAMFNLILGRPKVASEAKFSCPEFGPRSHCLPGAVFPLFCGMSTVVVDCSRLALGLHQPYNLPILSILFYPLALVADSGAHGQESE